MTTKQFKNNSIILEAVHETMSGFHAAGVIDDERMNEFNEWCLEPERLLDKDVFDYLNQKCDFNPEKMRVLINDWLRKDIEIARSVS
jgi:DNA-binding transcriptional regulator YiaG